MQLRPEMQIPSMIKAMMEVIIPSVDTGNELAVQQAQLLLGHLVLMSQRIPLQYRSDRDELHRLVTYAASLQSEIPGAEVFGPLVDEGNDVLDRARAESSEMLAVAVKLTAAVDQVIRAVFNGDDTQAQRILQSATLSMSKDQLLRDRAWIAMQGWEPDPASVPAIETLLPALSV